jgi:hypothetical protein
MMLQSKGGVGKSFCSSVLMQYFRETGRSVYGMDTDPSNHSFAEFSELEVQILDIMNGTEDIDKRRFDKMVDSVCRLGPDDHIVIDTGSSCYKALFAYLQQNEAFNVIKEAGHQAFIHSPISGGADISATMGSLLVLVAAFPALPFVIWKNPYHGQVVNKGKPFEEFVDFPKIKKHVVGIIEIPNLDDTFTKDIVDLMAARITFKKAAHPMSSDFTLMVKNRFKIFWRELCANMKSSMFFDQFEPQARKGKEERGKNAGGNHLASPANSGNGGFSAEEGKPLDSQQAL